MNIRQQQYKKNRMLGMNKYNAARAAGFSESTAKSHTQDLENRVRIPDVLERQGLTDSFLVGKLTQLINATKDVYSFSGQSDEEKGVNVKLGTPDWSARAKGLELALKLKDLLREKVEHSGEIKTGGTKIILITSEERKPTAIVSRIEV